MSGARLAFILAASLLAAAPLSPAGAPSAAAQGLGFGAGGAGGQPVEITARDGIEWLRDSQRYVARGDASAKQGDTTVAGDILTAYYRTQPGGGTEIFRYEAQGHVRIFTPNQQAVGDKGVYDVDTGVLVLTGSNLKFTTPTDTLTARDSLEYWEGKRSAVARGAAVAVSQDRRMTGEILTAYFADPAAPAPRPAPAARPPAAASRAPAQQAPLGGGRLQRIEGFGGVHVSTATDIVEADRGVYRTDTGVAQMSGNVKITRGNQALTGEFVEVNLNTGVSRLLSSGGGQVRGVLTPGKDNATAPSPAPAARPATRPAAPPARTGAQNQPSPNQTVR